ncbi:SDR family NAD(P)-dependent oxidoreductase [Kribbella sp. NPDC049174]|uniref:SDR family NAD(P)-dependent oxidoreductase n=1 Tax=Kribbella sp. NPDC049174 TaxID=3364112 RepID=UPI0037118F95
MTHRFEDRIALVTGGSSGMGLAAARRLLAEGAHVVITGRDKTRLDAAAEDLRGTTAPTDRHAASPAERVVAVAGDAASLADLDSLVTTVRDRFGRLDVVFANAGVAAFEPAEQTSEAEFDRVVDINFKGVFFTVQKLGPLLTDGAAVVINASWTIQRGLAGASVYAATKAAVHNLTHTFAAELAPRRIRVNSVSPGYIETPMFHDNVTPEAHAAVVAAVPAGRIGTAEDVAAAVAFLASDEASYINGQDLIIDGGLVTAGTPV